MILLFLEVKPVQEIELFSKPFGFGLLQHPLWCKPVSGYVKNPRSLGQRQSRKDLVEDRDTLVNHGPAV
jgi:hypothetical protein